MTIDQKALEKAVATAIFDPGATEGMKGERTLTEWQVAAVMRALATQPAQDQVEHLFDGLDSLERFAPKVVPMGANPPLFDGMQPDNDGPWLSRVAVARYLRQTIAAIPASDHTGLVERLRAHAETQIEDNIDYIQKADDLMREAATALSAQAFPAPLEGALTATFASMPSQGGEWVMVPRTETDEMCEAGLEALRENLGHSAVIMRDAAACYRAMVHTAASLSASPSPYGVEDAPDEFGFVVGEPVEKFTGEARWEGILVASYLTTKGKRRYVVEVMPQGFQMIAVPGQLRMIAALSGDTP